MRYILVFADDGTRVPTASARDECRGKQEACYAARRVSLEYGVRIAVIRDRKPLAVVNGRGRLKGKALSQALKRLATLKLPKA